MPSVTIGGIQMESAVVRVLGGRKYLGKRISSLSDFEKLIREGFWWESVSHAKETVGLTDQQPASLLNISERTLIRFRKSKKRLSPVASDRLYRLALIYSFAREVFEDDKMAREWLHKPQYGLGGRVPLEMLQTEAGAREVEDLLGRIEYGITS
jgi:putative toxin-antitoxin system antitoxin component (TIGR02293 family)